MSELKLAILGTGTIAHTMAKTATLMPGVVPYATAAREPARAEAFAREFGMARAYGSYEEMVRDDAIDLVYIATPHSHHAQHALLCIEAGRAVLCEKAFTGNAAQARRVLAAAGEQGVFVQEAMWTRFLPFMQTLRGLVDGGAIGNPVLVNATYGFSGRNVPRMREPALAGGALLDLGIYPLTLADMIFGPGAEATTGSAVLLDTGVDACSAITQRYAGGHLATLTSSMLCRLPDTWQVCGEEGALEIEGVANPRRARLLDNRGNEKQVFEAPPQLTGYEYEVAACAEALAGGARECREMPHADTLRMMDLMDGLRAEWGVRYPFD